MSDHGPGPPSHPFGGGFGPPPPTPKDPYSPPQNNLTLLKSAPAFQHFHDEPRADAFCEMRYVDLNWDIAYPNDHPARLLDSRAIDSPDNVIQYRPWEKPDSSQSPTLSSSIPAVPPVSASGALKSPSSSTLTTLTSAFPSFPESFNNNNPQKLPSFQSQFFPEHNPDLLNAPLPAFHTLPPNSRPYVHPALVSAAPIAPAPIQQQFLDDRHLQLFPAPINNGHHHYVMTSANGQPAMQLDLVSVPHPLHPPTSNSLGANLATFTHSNGALNGHSKALTTDGNLPGLNVNLNEASSLPKYFPQDPAPETLIAVKIPAQPQHHYHHLQPKDPVQSPQQVTNSTHHGLQPSQRKQKRKRNSTDAHEALSSSQHENEPQVSSVSSSDSDFKRPAHNHNLSQTHHADHTAKNGTEDLVDAGVDKPVKKKRKRCGECVGCQKKDNCGECAPCRNEKSHQICKMRRCEKLTEKKPSTRGEKMDGRGRQPSTQHNHPPPISYYTQPHTPHQGDDPAFSPRERFWTPAATPNNGPNTPESWTAPYTPQILPHDGFSPSQHSPHSSGSANFPAPYHPLPAPTHDFQGPTPPNQLQPISVVSSSFSSAGSPRRQYTPSTTPSPHVHQSPPNNPQPNGANAANGGATNGHANGHSSPPHTNNNNFDGYINGQDQANGAANGAGNGVQGANGHALCSPTKTALDGSTGHPNEVPGYLPLPRQSSQSSSRYSGDKASSGDMHQYPQPIPSPTLNYFPDYGAHNYDRAFDPFPPNFDPFPPNKPQTFLAIGHPQSPSGRAKTEDAAEHPPDPLPTTFQPASSPKTKGCSEGGRPKDAPKKKYRANYTPKPFISSEEKLERLCKESETEYATFKSEKEREQREQRKHKQLFSPKSKDKLNTDKQPDVKPKPFAPQPPHHTLMTSPKTYAAPPPHHAQHLHDDDDNDDDDDKKDVPLVECGCFPVDQVHPEPGPFYTHLGAAHSLQEMRTTIEHRTGFRGAQLRFEKVVYTGKEGKTTHGCPLAKSVIRRGSYEEQLLFVVKHRKGHKCGTAWIVICCVIWEGVPPHFADNLYDTLVYKLNRYGVPTTRRSDTNEQRSCACQGVDPDTQGAAYSFGCAWSMFFNGCKYARSRNVRKFRLTEEHEESELEEKVQHLATHLGPLYERVAPESYSNQIANENDGLECRLGYRPGRPFSGVTACLDYCSHAHKDAHNMLNGCTVTVSFTRNRSLQKHDDEQYHVLPLYKLDDTDEHGSKDGHKLKVKKGQLEMLKKFPSKVRLRKVPLLPSRRRGKAGKANAQPPQPSTPTNGASTNCASGPPSSNTSCASPKPIFSSGESSAQPPPAKREKTLLDDLPSLANGHTELFPDTRFHSPLHHPAFTNLLASKSAHKSRFGLEDVQSCQISSTVLDGDSTGSSASLWNHHFHHHPPPPPNHQPHQGPTPPLSFRSYFDPFANPPAQPAPAALQPQGGSAFGTNVDFPRCSGMGGMMAGGVSANTSTTATSGYSPILPSFRHTFMTEAESMSMMSSMSSPTGGSPPDSTTSPRSIHIHTPTHQQPLKCAPQPTNHLDSCATAGYFHAPTYSAPPTPNLYHAHHPPTSCLPAINASMSAPGAIGGSVPFPSAAPSSAAYPPAPPAFPAPNHLPPPQSSAQDHHFPAIGLSPWNNNNSYANSYGAPPTYHHAPSQHLPLPLPQVSAAYTHHPMANQYSAYPAPNNQPLPISPINPISHQPLSISPIHQLNPLNNITPLNNINSLGQINPMSGMNAMGAGWSSQLGHAFPPAQAPHHQPQAVPPPPTCFVAPPKPKVMPEVTETFSDNEDAFKDGQLGGVAIALTHGAVLLQCAKHEMHATTALKTPNRLYPSRISLVFYQHKSMNNRFHGWSEWEKKIEAKKLQEVKLINQGKLEASPRKMKQLIKEGYLPDNP